MFIVLINDCSSLTGPGPAGEERTLGAEEGAWPGAAGGSHDTSRHVT